MNIQSQKLAKPTDNQDSKEVDLLSLFWMLLRGWKVIVIFALVGLVVGVLYGRYVDSTYKADALLQIDKKNLGISALGANISSLVAPEASLTQTEAEIIKSRMVLEPVVNLLQLRIRLTDPTLDYLDKIKKSSTNSQINTPETVSLNTENGQAQVSQFNVSPDYLNQIFTLARSGTGFRLSNGSDNFKGQLNQPNQFQGSNGQIQITVTDLPSNEHPVNIRKQRLQDTTNDISKALTVVERGDQTGIIQLSLTGPDQQQVTLILKQIIISYIDQNQSSGSEETTKTIKFMETQIPALKQKLETSEGAFNDFREKYGTIDVSKEAELLLAESSQIDSQFNELNLKKAELTTYYTEEHPLVIQINDQIKVLNNRKRNINNTVKRLPEIQREFVKLSEDVGINREIYLNILKNYEQLKIVKAGQVGYARIIDLPVNTFIPISPKKTQIWLLTTLVGILLGTALVMLKSLMKNVVKDPERLEARLGVPVIATIPRSKSLMHLSKNKQASNRLLAYVDHDSLSYEGIKSLRTYLMFGSRKEGDIGQSGRVILISGESPNVGKSFIVANLAEVFAQLDKKVLIVDADMRLGNLHRTFNIENNTGLADYFSDNANTVASITHPTGIDNIDFIPRGEHPYNPSSLLATDKFGDLIAQLASQYDYIIIDSPPVLAATDAVILSQYADKVLMVTRYNNSIEGQLAYAIKQMNKANVEVDGIVLNDMQQGKLDKYSYHYAYTYGTSK